MSHFDTAFQSLRANNSPDIVLAILTKMKGASLPDAEAAIALARQAIQAGFTPTTVRDLPTANPANATSAVEVANDVEAASIADVEPAQAAELVAPAKPKVAEVAPAEAATPIIIDAAISGLSEDAARSAAEPVYIPNFREIAMRSVARGETRVLPIVVGGKNPSIKWKDTPFDTASTDEWAGLVQGWIEEQAAKFPNANVAVVAKTNERLFIDEDDSEEFRAGYELFSGEDFPRTYSTSARANRLQSHWLQTDATRKMGNVAQTKTFSVRQFNLYVLAEGSQHKNGVDVYKVVDDSPAIPMPDKLVAYIESLRVRPKHLSNDALTSFVLTGSDEEKLAQLLAEYPDGSIEHGSHDVALTSIAGKLHQVLKMDEEMMYPILVDICERCCVGYGTDYLEMCRKIAKSVGRYPIHVETPIYSNGKLIRQGPLPTPKPVVVNEPSEQISAYAMTPEEIELENEKEFPCIPLKEPPGPVWDDEIMYGPVGDFVRKASKYNEGHAAGMYSNMIVSLGNAFGRAPYFQINATRHYTNEFLANVGPSAHGRKGSGRDVVNNFMKLIDPDWAKERTMSGFGSGESIINEIRDASRQTITVKQKGKPPKFEEVDVPGVSDKRLCIRTSELAGTFVMAARPESLASVILRDGWDSSPLSNLVKGKTAQGMSLSARCEHPHISITGDISPEELVKSLPDGSENNGFGNRFLYCYGFPTKKCAHGGPDIDWSEEVAYFFLVVQEARTRGYVPMSKAANAVWKRMYLKLGDEMVLVPGLAGKMIARGEAHVRRLAMILALVDKSEMIETAHLKAAKALWDYYVESARFIFLGTTKEVEKIVSWVAAQGSTGPVTIPQITQGLFHKNQKADWVRGQVDAAVKKGRLVRNGETVSLPPSLK